MRYRFFIVFMMVCLCIIGCKSQENITVSGSSTVLPIMVRVAEQFKLNQPDVNIIVNGGGSGVGVQQLKSGLVDVAMISRSLTQEEIQRFDGMIETHAIGVDTVVPAVSAALYDDGVTVLSIEQLRQIYSGNIDNWQEVGGPDKSILVIDKEMNRGTRHVFMKVLFGDAYAKATGADLVLGSNNEEQTAIVQSDRAIGMLSFAWLNDKVKGIDIVMADNQTLSVGDVDYPFKRVLLLVTHRLVSPKIRQLFDFIDTTSGRALVAQAGYVPKS